MRHVHVTVAVLFFVSNVGFTNTQTTRMPNPRHIAKLNASYKSVTGNCEFVKGIMDDATRLGMDNPEFEEKLWDKLSSKNETGRYYIKDTNCKKELQAFLGTSCEYGGIKGEVACEMMHLASSSYDALEKYKSLTPDQKQLVRSSLLVMNC